MKGNFGHKGFKDKSRYKHFEGDKNIIIGNAELVYVIQPIRGWITLCGNIITNKQDAINYAKKLNELYTYNEKRVFKPKRKYD